MKKLFFFATLIAATAFGLTSCSDSNGGDSPSGGDGEGQTAYLAVKINDVGSVPGMSSSKAFLRDNTYDYNDAVIKKEEGKDDKNLFINGDGDEGKLTNVRFYFFNSDGTPYTIAATDNGGTGISNYLDQALTTNTEQEDDATTIERKSEVVLVIKGTTAGLPARMAAVVNPGALDPALGSGTLTESQLAALSKTTTRLFAGDGFAMTNSVYLDESANVPLIATPIDASYFQTKQSEAEKAANAVPVYVERIAARVDVNAPATGTETTTDSKTAYALASTDATHSLTYINPPLKEDGSYNNGAASVSTTTINQLYVVVDGWGLADENNNTSIVKNLASSYTNLTDADGPTLATEPLSVAAYHRSFWETTAETYSPIRYTYNNYLGNGTPTEGVAYGKKLGERAYTFPNTLPGDYTTANLAWNANNRRPEVANTSTQAPTKVVVAAHLAYKDGGTWKNAEICTYRGQKYLGEDNVKAVIANDIAHSTANNIYKLKSGTHGNDDAVYESIAPADFTFTATNSTLGNKESYLLKPVLPEDNATQFYRKSYTNGNSENPVFTALDDAAVNASLLAVADDDITIYKDGMTYYYTTLQHLWFPSTAITNASSKPDNVGAWGVVRNHLYKVTLNSFTGLGTPVYNPDQVIIPITPKDENVYLGAQINVLQWRVVDQTANIDGSILPADNH